MGRPHSSIKSRAIYRGMSDGYYEHDKVYEVYVWIRYTENTILVRCKDPRYPIKEYPMYLLSYNWEFTQ